MKTHAPALPTPSLYQGVFIMKKQLMIAAITCALSGVAFAAIEGTHTINFTVAPPVSQLEIGGSLITTEATSTVNFDTNQLDSSTIRKTLGNITLTASNYSPTLSATCRIYAESAREWTLSYSDTSPAIKYGLVRTSALGTNPTVNLGFQSQTDSSATDATSTSGGFFTALGNNLTNGTTAAASAGSCAVDESLDILIKGFTRPTVSTTTTFTDTITFKVVVI